MSIGTLAGQNDFKESFPETTSGAGLNYALHVIESVQISVVAQICVQNIWERKTASFTKPMLINRVRSHAVVLLDL